jgi:hypothetical protein
MAAQIDRPVLPPLLYRYRRLRNDDRDYLHREIEAIIQQHLWCSHYRDLNDPMEGFFEPSLRLQRNTSYSKISRRLFTAKQDIGICCFSDTFDSELMWTHYARNYTGICVGYRTEQLVVGLPPDVHLVRLAYDGAPPRLGKGDEHDLRATAIKVLSHKKVNWIYEREWRLLGRQGLLPIASKRCISEIRLGSRIEDHHRAAILNAFHNTKIKISSMTVVNYEHRWQPETGKRARPRPAVVAA